MVLTNYESYIGGIASPHSMVGYASGKTYCARFGPFTAPATGATGVSISGQFNDNQGEKAGPSWYITESDSSHANAGVGAASHGILTMTLTAGVYVGTGSASVTLKPGGSYYLWLFPSVAAYGIWGHYESITVTTSGSATVTITEFHYGLTESGYEPLTSTTHTVPYGSAFIPVAIDPGAKYTATGSTYQLWSPYNPDRVVVVTGKKTGVEGFVVDGTYDTTIDVFYPLRTYTLSISAGTGSTVTVKRGNSALTNGATISHGDVLTISFGVDTGYDLSTHTVNGGTFASGGSYTVSGAVEVKATATIETYAITLYHYRADPSGKPVLFEDDTAYADYGSAYTPKTLVPPTGNTTTGSTFHYWTAGQAELLGGGKTGEDSFTVTGDRVVEIYYPLCTYSLTISADAGSGITVIRGDESLKSGAVITHGDVLTITFYAEERYSLTEHTVNGVSFDSGDTHTVSGAVAVTAAAEVLAYAIGTDLYHAFIGDDAGGSLYVTYIGDENGMPVPYGQVN